MRSLSLTTKATQDGEEDEMPMLVWSDRLSVGVHEMDLQHRKLVDLLNELYEAMKSGRANRVVQRAALQSLLDYAQRHFRAEERLMAQADYSELEEHARGHEVFTERVGELHAAWLTGDDIGRDLLAYMREWILQHILIADKAYVRGLHEAGIR